ncbi:MAG: glycosyltransferase [Cyanobacteria bacterium P01_A01_bin.40]
MKKKLVFFISDLTYGGAQRQLAALARAIDKEIFEVYVLYYYPDGPLEKDLQDSQVILNCITKKGRWDLIGFYARLVSYLRKIKPDILHGYLVVPNLFTIVFKPLLPKTKIVWGIRNSNDSNARNEDWLNSPLALVEAVFSQFADLIVSNSHAGRDYCLNRGFPPQKTIVISNGIDIDRFQPDPEARVELRTEWQLAPETIAIGIIGRIHPLKDYPNFLQAAAILVSQHKNVAFFCFGTGEAEYEAEMYQLTQELNLTNKVRWMGTSSDIPSVCNALDLLVSASTDGEGFGNVIGEAMACGTPCVVTDVGDSAWIVDDSRLVVPRQNPQELAEAINQFLDLKERTENLDPRSRIVQNFSIAQLAINSKAAFLELLSKQT